MPTGPNHTLDLEAFFRFLVDCAKDPRFNADTMMPEINLAADLTDRPAGVPLSDHPDHPQAPDRTRGSSFSGSTATISRNGAGARRCDEPHQVLLAIRWPMDDSFGPTDMPSVWNLQKYREERGNRMNFAGDSHNAYSVIIDSALGLMGAEPKDRTIFSRTSTGCTTTSRQQTGADLSVCNRPGKGRAG